MYNRYITLRAKLSGQWRSQESELGGSWWLRANQEGTICWAWWWGCWPLLGV